MSKIEFIESVLNKQDANNEINKLASIYEQKTATQRNEPLFKLANGTTYFLQAVSVILALGAPVALADRMPKVAILAFAVGVVTLVLLELGKRFSLDALNVSRLADSRTSKAAAVGMVFCTALSMALSFVGAPVVVSKFTTHEALADTSVINAGFDSKQAATLAPLLASQKRIISDLKMHSSAGKKFDKKLGRVRLSSSSKLQIRELNKQLGKIESAIQKAKADNNVLRIEALSSANDNNAAILSKYDNFNTSFGGFASLAAILIDFLLFGLFAFTHSHRFNKLKETQAEAVYKQAIQPKPTVKKVKPVEAKPAPEKATIAPAAVVRPAVKHLGNNNEMQAGLCGCGRSFPKSDAKRYGKKFYSAECKTKYHKIKASK